MGNGGGRPAMKFLYGDSWEKFPIKANEVWNEQRGSKVMVADLFDGIPSFMHNTDMVYSDTPWTTGNLKTFYTKAEKPCAHTFLEFAEMVFQHIDTIHPKVCYLEIGRENMGVYERKLRDLFPIVQSWDILYYRKHPMKLLRGGPEIQQFDFTGMDDEKTPGAAMLHETILSVVDFCLGRGGTLVAAYKLGKICYGSELNPRRLAVGIEKIVKLGGKWLNVSHLCKKCGKLLSIDEDKLRPDPYQADVYGDFTEFYICNDCHENLIDEI